MVDVVVERGGEILGTTCPVEDRTPETLPRVHDDASGEVVGSSARHESHKAELNSDRLRHLKRDRDASLVVKESEGGLEARVIASEIALPEKLGSRNLSEVLRLRQTRKLREGRLLQPARDRAVGF